MNIRGVCREELVLEPLDQEFNDAYRQENVDSLGRHFLYFGRQFTPTSWQH